MATTYQELHALFLSKISDYSFLNLTIEELEGQLERYLKSSVSRFRFCKSDLADRDEVLKQFNADLSDLEKEVLVSLMTVEYLKPKIVTSEILKQSLSSKDYQMYSQANHLKELTSLYKQIKAEADKIITEYTFLTGDMENLK
jgi:hypothetical protein